MKPVVVIGGVNMDIGGRPYRPLVPMDSNPGTIRFAPGGVGRNIAHNLSLMGGSVQFLTALGDDPLARQIEENCEALGIDISHARKVQGAATSTYMYIMNAQGDMELAVCDMEICASLDANYLAQQQDVLDGAAAIAADGNLSEKTWEWLGKHAHVPLFADPVSAAKAGRLRGSLGAVHTLKPNRIEAEVLTGIRITDEGSAFAAADKLLEEGVGRVFISLGTKGVAAAQQGGEKIYVPCIEAKETVNTNGAGDAYVAGLIWAYLQDLDLYGSALAAAAAASIAVESDETINPLMSGELILSRLKQR